MRGRGVGERGVEVGGGREEGRKEGREKRRTGEREKERKERVPFCAGKSPKCRGRKSWWRIL